MSAGVISAGSPIQPEMQAEPDLKKYADGREDDGDENTNDVHEDWLSSL